MNDIWFAGDPHGSIKHLLWHLERTPMPERPAAIILLGDIEATRPLGNEIKPFLAATAGSGQRRDDLAADVEVFWIRGNHDTDSEHSWRNLQGAMDRNIDGKVIEVGGLRIAGLGGVFRGEVWVPPDPPSYASLEAYRRALKAKQPRRLRDGLDEFNNGKLRKHQSTIFPDIVERLRKQRADILVTHEPPTPHPYGQQVLADLARDMGVRLHVHGHTHDALPYPLTATGCKVMGVGLRGITTAGGHVIKPGDADADNLRTFERHGGLR